MSEHDSSMERAWLEAQRGRMELAGALGELRGDVRAMLASMSRLAAQIDEHLVSDEKAHARQDERILDITEKLATAEGRHGAAILWMGLVGGIIGAILMALLPDALSLAHRL